MATAELCPLSLGELLDRTFSYYRSHFWLFVGIMAVPQTILSVALLCVGSETTAAAMIFLALLPVYTATYTAALAATVFAVSDLHLGRPASVATAYARARGRFWRLLWVAILWVVSVALGTALVLIPGIIIMVRASLAIPAAMLEQQKGWKAVQRSESLTTGYNWRIFLVFFLFFIIYDAALLIFSLPSAAAEYFLHDPSRWASVLSILGTFLPGLFVAPLIMVALTLVYYDLRVRKEGFDLQLMMAALDQTTVARESTGSTVAAVTADTAVAPYAGFWLRLLAALIDGLILTAAFTGFALLIRSVLSVQGSGQGPEIFLVPIIPWPYFTIAESSKWQATLGKKLVGIIVTDLNGNRIGFGRANARYWSKFISAGLLYIGFFMVAMTRRKQALHDLCAGTLVVHGPRSATEQVNLAPPERAQAPKLAPF